MTDHKFCLAGHSAALKHTAAVLKSKGYVLLPKPDPTATHLLLPVPSFEADGTIKGGGDLKALLSQLPEDVTVLGGNLDRPELAGYRTVDLLRDPQYLAENANITAHCAVRLAMAKLPVILDGCPVLVIGWGRIGKCLAKLLRAMGAQVTVAARKAADRAMLSALGYDAAVIEALDPSAYRVIFNTAPQMLLPTCPGNGLKVDLASRLGIGGLDVIWARGLPGKDAPESSGELIARTVIRVTAGKE